MRRIPLSGIVADLLFSADLQTIRCSPGGDQLSDDALIAIALLMHPYAAPTDPAAA